MAQWYVTVYIKTPFASILLMDDTILYHRDANHQKKAMAIFLTELSI